MTVIELSQEANASSNNNVVFIDKEFEFTGTVLATAGFLNTTDRIFDVRGFLGFFLKIINDSGVSIDFELFQSSSHKDTSQLTILDFDVEVIPETIVTDGNSSTPFEFVRATPMVTAYLLRLRRNAGAGNVTLKGIVAAN